MKLYLISQDANSEYDTYDSAVVRAPDAETARGMSPNNGLPMDWSKSDEWARSIDQVNVQYLGEAIPGSEQGLVLSSYNAG